MPKWLSRSLSTGTVRPQDKQKGRKPCLTPKLKKEIENGLKSSWSPEQICGRYQLEQKQNKDCLVTLLERKTRFYLAFMILGRTAKSMFSAI